MGLFDGYKKQSTTTEEIHDGYSIISLNKKFINELKKKFSKEADKEYRKRQIYAEKNDGAFVLPTDYNARAIKYRMQIEGALYDEGIVGIQINESSDFQLDYEDYLKMESALLQKNVEIMLFNNQNEKIFLSPNNKENINEITKEIYKSIINKREEYGLNTTNEGGFLNKEMSFEEQKFLRQMALEDIASGLYLGNQNLALGLLTSDFQLSKIILQEKHKKDIEKILTFLNIEHIIMENTILIEKKNLNKINSTITDYIQGAVFVKDKQIYGLNKRIESVQEEVKTNEEIRENKIDELINDKKQKEVSKEYQDVEITK